MRNDQRWGAIPLLICTFASNAGHAEPITCEDETHRYIRRGADRGCVDARNRKQGQWRQIKYGQVVSKTMYQDDKRNGIHSVYNNAKKLSHEGTYANNQKSGTWKYYDDSGRLKTEETYRSDVRHGPYRTWYANCVEKTSGHYEDGKQSGRWQYFNDEGVLILEGEFKSDQKNGQWMMFSQKGVRQESGQYLDDRKTGKWIEYLPTGEQWRTVNYVDGERNSVDSQNCAEQGGSWTVKFDSLEEGCEQGPMGFKLGTWRSYHLNGSIKLVTPYKENALHGLVKGYHPTGQLHRIGRFEQGQPVRSHSYFNANGSIIGESYIDKNGHGKWEVWHHTGAIAETGDYGKGKKNGL